jgi:hypothetical protein
MDIHTFELFPNFSAMFSAAGGLPVQRGALRGGGAFGDPVL